MKSERTESFLKWATLVTSALALVVASVREPLALSLKAAILEVLRQELGRYETASASEARWQRQQETANEVLRRCERELAALRDLAASESHGRPFIDVSNRLSSLELKVEQLKSPR
ncbi:MAG TPA: hypothetical protein VNH84_15800 [Candidatus Saccharimonadales bacterium]|nr:hypothetical protein [Candidatus Saccharimonadales bacterium]